MLSDEKTVIGISSYDHRYILKENLENLKTHRLETRHSSLINTVLINEEFNTVLTGGNDHLVCQISIISFKLVRLFGVSQSGPLLSSVCFGTVCVFGSQLSELVLVDFQKKQIIDSDFSNSGIGQIRSMCLLQNDPQETNIILKAFGNKGIGSISLDLSDLVAK